MERTRHDSRFVWALLLAWLATKAVLVLVGAPSMTVWLDELYYYTTAFDLGHWGDFGVPHPGFLNYPPLTSALTAPAHWFPFPAPWPYRMSLLMLTVIVGSTLLATDRLSRELFGGSSRFACLLVAGAAPAYLGFSLMSEPVFVALYAWYLVLLTRYLRRGAMSAAAGAAVISSAMVLTRPTGIGLALAALAGVAFDILASACSRRPVVRSRIAVSLLLALVPVATYGLWSSLRRALLGTGVTTGSLSWYLRRGVRPLFDSPSAIWEVAERLGANLAYISLSTFVLGVVAVGWYLVGDPVHSSPRDRTGRRVLVEVAAFALITAAMAAVHMYLHRTRDVPKYEMYGRYVDYFSVPLVVVLAGVAARLSRNAWPLRLRFLAAVALAGALSWWVVPAGFWEPFATRIVHPAPNHGGIAWLIMLARTVPSSLSAVAIGLPLLLAVGLTLPARQKAWRRVAGGCLVLLFYANAASVVASIVKRSTAARGRYESFARFVAEHPDVFAHGLVLDSTIDSHPAAHLYTHLYVDHLEKVLVDTDLEPHLGHLPIVTGRDLEGLPLLFPPASDPQHRLLRIYGPRRAFGR